MHSGKPTTSTTYKIHLVSIYPNGMSEKDDYYKGKRTSKTQYGLDGAQERAQPLIKSIQIFALHKQQFTSFTLVNPVITTFAHDDLDQTDGAGLMANTMQIVYETVLIRCWQDCKKFNTSRICHHTL
jgi:hypothetical protein